jgi:Homeobox KN domain
VKFNRILFVVLAVCKFQQSLDPSIPCTFINGQRNLAQEPLSGKEKRQSSISFEFLSRTTFVSLSLVRRSRNILVSLYEPAQFENDRKMTPSECGVKVGIPRELKSLSIKKLLHELEDSNHSIDIRLEDDEAIALHASSIVEEESLFHHKNKGVNFFNQGRPMAPGRFAHMDNEGDQLSADDNTRMVGHENFKRIIFLTIQVKNLQDAMSRGSQATPTQLAESLNHREAHRLIDRLISANCPHPSASTTIICRGLFPIIDELLDKMMGSLVTHYQYLQDTYHRLRHSFDEEESTRKRKKDSKSIVFKYTKERTDYLYGWMDDYAQHPYPDTAAIEFLSLGSGLQFNQVNNWATNIRKRKVKAIIHQRKKPNDYFDFRFLAEHRKKCGQVDPSCSSPVAKRLRQVSSYGSKPSQLVGYRSSPPKIKVLPELVTSRTKTILDSSTVLTGKPFEDLVFFAENWQQMNHGENLEAYKILDLHTSDVTSEHNSQHNQSNKIEGNLEKVDSYDSSMSNAIPFANTAGELLDCDTISRNNSNDWMSFYAV